MKRNMNKKANPVKIFYNVLKEDREEWLLNKIAWSD